MTQQSQDTDPQNTPGTDGKPPAATPDNGGGSANQDGDQVTLSRDDYNNLVGQRDRANEAARGAETQEDFLLELAKEREIDSWLKDNGKDYPDVSREDLMHAESPEDLEDLAKKTQQRLTALIEKKLQDVEIADNRPKLTDSERAERVNKLRNSNDPQAFEKMVDLRLSK